MLPSKIVVEFLIPDNGMLLRSGRLTDRLKRTALLCAGHPDGPEGFMGDLVAAAAVSAEAAERVEQAIEDGIQLQHLLVSEMLVDPQVTVDEVAAGEIPEPDIRMLLEFAERKRNVDAGGNRLPVIVLLEWASFRDEPEGDPGAGDGGTGGPVDAVDVPDVDGVAV